MRAIILGAGIAGVITAYQLAKKGFQVTILDKNDSPAQETSFANGGQLSYSYKTPIATPELFKLIPKISLGLDPAFKINPTINPDFYHWVSQFLWQCSPANSRHSSKVMQQIGALSKRELMGIIEETQIKFDHRRSSGKLYIYQDNKIFTKVKKQHSNKQDSSLWSKTQLKEKIPALRNNQRIVGALFDIDEDVADCQKFCVALMQYLQEELNVVFLNNQNIKSIQTKQHSVIGITTDNDDIQGDIYILATGINSNKILKSLNTKLPIYPIKGYSITVPATDQCPNISLTDTVNKTVYCRLGNRLRIAGLAEFAGMDNQTNQNSIEFLLNNARQFLPNAGDYDNVQHFWSGLRPSTPDSLPIVGASTYDNLYFNTGHGMLGWTHSAATAKLLTNLIIDQKVNFDMQSISAHRFD